MPIDLKLYLNEIEKKAILKALESSKGNIKKASQMLSLPRKTFYRKLRKYKMK